MDFNPRARRRLIDSFAFLFIHMYLSLRVLLAFLFFDVGCWFNYEGDLSELLTFYNWFVFYDLI